MKEGSGVEEREREKGKGKGKGGMQSGKKHRKYNVSSAGSLVGYGRGEEGGEREEVIGGKTLRKKWKG